MGTTNLTAVFYNGEYKVAQYGQWGGYPGGQGLTALNFLRNEMDETQFKQKLSKTSFISEEGRAELFRKYGADKNGYMSEEDVDRLLRDCPQFSRDYGAKILTIVQNSSDGILLQDFIEFAADSLFCEWAWVIDFDARTFEAYKGFNQASELTESDRFFFLKDKEESGYHGVRIAAKWSLDELPSDEEFLATFKSEEDDDE